MGDFLQSQDVKVWLTVDVRWTKPIETLDSWDDKKIKDANYNSRALQAAWTIKDNEKIKDANCDQLRILEYIFN